MNGYILTTEQTNQLKSLAYWLAEVSYLKERGDRYTPADMERARANVRYNFTRCDELNISWRVQNEVIAWADDWRRDSYGDLKADMLKRGMGICFTP